MSKRKLTKQQNRRIARRQESHAQKAKHGTQSEEDDSQLGAEQTGLVISHFGTQVDVEKEDASIIRCHLRANIGSIVTGDKVIWREKTAEESGVVVSILPRASELHRPDGYGKLKLIAANVTQAFIVIAPEPQPFHNLIDRYLVITEHLGIKPFLLVNKSDLDSFHNLREFIQPYQKLGYTVCHTSAKKMLGLEALCDQLSDAVSIFVGQSGVGKSSIIQALLPNEEIKIGKLSDHVRKGKHTTTHARLYHFENGGSCIDSPGIREFGLWHLEPEDVANGFIEFRPFLGQCKFRDCRHENDPGCALTAALEEGKISPKRFTSFRHIIETLDEVKMQKNTDK